MNIFRMKRINLAGLSLFLYSLALNLGVKAQEVTVVVTPVQQVLPPQAMQYINTPGKYFNITLINNTSVDQDTYLGLSVEQVMPATGLSVSTPTRRQPKAPITIKAGQTRTLTMVEMKNLFNHFPSSELRASPGLIETYSGNDQGLLPEGQYCGQIIAYKWDLAAQTAVALSSSSGGRCYFTICYKAQAPEFITPMPMSGGELLDLSVATLDKLNPQFTWREPLVTCNPGAAKFLYNFKIVELMPNQQPDDAMDRNAPVYQVNSLMSPMVTIPQYVFIQRIQPGKTYLAQVKAVQIGVGDTKLNWLMIENDGKSPYRMFQIEGEEPVSSVSDTGSGGSVDVKPDTGSGGGSDGLIRDMDEESDAGMNYGKKKETGGKEGDSLYVFSLPKINHPTWDKGMTRKVYLGGNIDVEWDKISKTGGTGQRGDTLDVKYDVELFSTTYDADYSEAFKQKPIFKKTVNGDNDELTIDWDDDLEKLELVHNDYLVLRVKPVISNEKSIRFEKGEENIIGFALSEHTTKSYFECSSTVEITNRKATKKKDADLIGKTVKIGEYNLTIDKIEKVKGKDFFKGRGHVEWNPMGIKTMVAVKFDTLLINTDDQVYDGRVKSYPDEAQLKESNADVVDKLFSEMGIDDFFGDNSIPYASEIQSKITDAAYSVAQKVNIKDYYKWVKSGKSAASQFMKGEVSDLHTPVSIPRKYNNTPCDIQIASMVFGPNYATMDIIGELTMPDTEYTENEILIFGAPRLCISPNTLLPESGTVALLGDFTIVVPKTSFKCTFKCPKNALTPEDGTYISWHGGEFEQLGIDVLFHIPNTYKEVNGKLTEENATLRVTDRLDSWDTFVMSGNMDPFQVSGAPGYTFTAKNVVIDLSENQNNPNMKLPKGYDRTKTGISQDTEWQGLYVENVSVAFPESFEFGVGDSKRLNVALEHMLFDKSGATFSTSANNIFEARTGKVGGWAFTMDKVFMNVIQDDFRDCGFNGRFSVPLLRDPNDEAATIKYDCRILKIQEGIGKGENAYVFKTQQVGDLSFDFLLAQTSLKEHQTYFLVEAVPDEKDDLNTNVELVMGGDITINGMRWVDKQLKKVDLDLDLSLKGIHFCGMRIANCKNDWVSRFEKEMQTTAKNAKLQGKEIYKGTELELIKDNLYFSTGRFSFSSEEKWLGPFNFSLDKYNFSYLKEDGKDLLKFSIGGSIKLLDNLDLSGVGGGFSIITEVKNLSAAKSDFSKIEDVSLAFHSVDFEDIKIDCKVAGCKLEGELHVQQHNEEREGFDGKLKFTLPGKFLADLDCEGGFYRNKKDGNKFNWGWFHVELDSKAGMALAPIQIGGGELGFYYNCARDKDKNAVPQKDCIGFILGLKLAALDPTMWSCDVHNTTIFDVKKGCLSSMVFTGKFSSMSGSLSGDCNLTYAHDPNDHYLSLDVTLDGRTSTDKMVDQVLERFGADMEDLKATLNSGYEKLKQIIPTGSLQDQVGGGEKGNPGKNENGSQYNGDDLSMKAGLGAERGYVINFGLKLTFKKDGKDCSPVKWYVCLGEPPFDKRCSYTWLKLNAAVLKCDIGANGYVCIGNDLYDNGNLPPIPDKIRAFLNGKGIGKNGGSMEGASLSVAERARQNQLKDFESQLTKNGGGIMFGAQIYGYFNVDLALIKLDAGVTAGFDVSLIKLSDDTYCINLKDKNGQVLRPGWQGWYARGQLYAYLYAKLGIYIDLGFYSTHWDLLDAGVGGVFNFQGPNPTHFSGEARVKLKLMNGWINIDRKYEFDVGEGCNLFMGNALDDFKLFGDLDIAKDDRGGWDYDNRINPKLISKPILNTEAPLDEPFRVVDPTDLSILKSKNGNSDVDVEALEREASRTFIFRSNVGSSVTVYEFTDSAMAHKADKYWAAAKLDRLHVQYKYKTYKFNIKNLRYKNVLDIIQFNPNCWYKIEVNAYAKEILYGKEEDPRKWNTEKKKYESVPWSRTKTYYFRTGPAAVIPDEPEDLQEYVAIALPSYYNKLTGDTWLKTHNSDVHRPTISLTTDLSGKCYKNGKLIWRLKKYYGGDLISESPNKWVTDDNVCIMTPENELTGFTNGQQYSLTLNYEHQVMEEGKMVNKNEILACYYVIPQNTDWSNDVYDYEKPFVGIRADKVNIAFKQPDQADYVYMINGGTSKLGDKTKKAKLADPYTWFSYLSNWAFIGGWEFGGDRIDANISTSQSLIYMDRSGLYEGKLSPDYNAKNIMEGAAKMRQLNIYDESQWSEFTQYPLPIMSDEKFNYALPGMPRAVEFVPSQKTSDQQVRMASNYLSDWCSPWSAAVLLNTEIQKNLKTMDDFDSKGKDMTARFNSMENWYNQRRGGYATVSHKNIVLQIPYYQFPILYGSCLNNYGVRKKLTAWGTFKGLETACKSNTFSRGHEEQAEFVFASLYGKDKRTNKSSYINHSPAIELDTEVFTYDSNWLKAYMPTASFTYYRCNAYDIVNGCYTVNQTIYNDDEDISIPIGSFQLKEPLFKYEYQFSK